ncbi:MAG: ChrR family anti-sigma-E factor [Sphingomonadales bacterium]|nr:ChrR family anti-sigma-E factor [Sphingomonadales bacterium]
MITHHPSDEALARMAAGGLAAGPALVVATHLAGCAECRARVADYEAAAGALLADETPVMLRADAFARTLARIDAPDVAAAPPPVVHPDLPPPLNRCAIGPWRFVHPRLRWRRLVLPQDPAANVIMLKVGAGFAVPHHSHTGREFTQVISGGFSDALGRYAAGDCIEADADIDHQPLADSDEPCVVLAAVEGRLRLRNWLGRLAQPLIGL